MRSTVDEVQIPKSTADPAFVEDLHVRLPAILCFCVWTFKSGREVCSAGVAGFQTPEVESQYRPGSVRTYILTSTCECVCVYMSYIDIYIHA